ncbi:MAB_1171c family putative transporter [Nocardia sp. NPDC052566]|uniref:MAB_1171c family putative transporter n=1 Tax=Nocardia sp. NPDC052566 TaxID=3364330 RepID=UPI0037C5E2C6
MTVVLMAFVAGRFALFRVTVVDRLVNRMFAWGAASLLLFRFASTAGSSAPLTELALGCALMQTTFLYAIGSAHRGDAGPDALWRRQRRCGLLTLSATVAMLIAGAAARGEGRPVEAGHTWDGLVVAIAIGMPVAINSTVFTRMVVRQYRTGELSSAERRAGAGVIAGSLFVWVNLLLSGCQLTTGWPELGPHLPRVELVFTVCLVINAIAPAFTLSAALLRAVSLDREGRACRRLDPLWRDLTAAVPEIVMHSPSTARDPSTRVFRMTVEIRDALMHLAPYMPGGPPTIAESTRGTEEYAKQVAHAANARMAGLAPTHTAVGSPAPLGSGDFDTDLGQLLELARAWWRLRGRSAPVGASH